MIHPSQTLTVTCGLLLALPALAQETPKPAADTILLRSGQRIRGVEVTAMTSGAVQYQRDGEAGEVAIADFSGIRWDAPPEAFGLAQAAMDRGDYGTAAELFAQAATETTRDVFAAEANYLAGAAMTRAAGGDPARAQAAVGHLQGWIDGNAEGKRIPDAMLALARAQSLAGDATAADDTYAALEARVDSEGWDRKWVAHAKLGRAEAQMRAEQHPAARATFRDAVTTATPLAQEATGGPMDALLARAALGEGRSFIQEAKYEEALAYFESLRDKAGQPMSVSAAAWAGTGEALFLRCQAQGNQLGLREAQIALARASMRDGSNDDIAAMAHYYNGKILLALGSERESADFATRAKDYFQTAVEYYPGTRWATMASRELED